MSKATYAGYNPDKNTTVEEVLANVQIPAHLEQIGTPADAERFTVGQELEVQAGFINNPYPQGLRVRVERLYYMDEEYFYWMPVVVIEDNPNAEIMPGKLSDRRMFNPDHLKEL